MKILAIDTSSKVLGVAVLDENGHGMELNYDLGLRHTSHLVPTIKRVLDFSNLRLKDLDALCVSIGPGSFTGLRIGVSTAKAFTISSRKRLVAVPSLDVLAKGYPCENGKICVLVDAKKDKFYSCFYEYKRNRLKRISRYLLVSAEEISSEVRKKRPDCIIGDGISKVRGSGAGYKGIEFVGEKFWYPRAINVAEIGLEMFKAGKVVKDVDRLAPVYMHPRDVQCKVKR